MPELLRFESRELPTHIKYQITSFVRIEWSWIFQGDNRLWDYTDKEDVHPVNFVLVEGDLLISHAEVNWRTLTHEGETYKVYGVSGVFTYPSFRKEGHGGRVVEAATQYVRESDADFAILFCDTPMKGFYQARGWSEIKPALYGDRANPSSDESATMILLVSEKAKLAREHLENKPIFVGGYTW